MDEILDDLGSAGHRERGRDGRIYAKQVVGRRKWDPWWGPIKWPVEGLQRSTWDSQQSWQRGGERATTQGNLEALVSPARPLLQMEGKATTAGCSGRVGGRGDVQGYRGTTVRTLHLPVSPPTCQPANRPSNGATVRLCVCVCV